MDEILGILGDVVRALGADGELGPVHQRRFASR
jgi:hypothetical protein